MPGCEWNGPWAIHVKKCFDGIKSLVFQKNLDITAMCSAEGEIVEFEYEKVEQDIINPNNTGGNVEVWLLQTEWIMRKTVAQSIDDAMVDYQKRPRLEFAIFLDHEVEI